MECGDSCTVSTVAYSDVAESSAADQCVSPVAYCSLSFESGSCHIAHCGSSSKIQLADQEHSVYKAANLLRGLNVNEIENVQQCTDGFAGDHEENTCKSICNCVNAASETVASQCYNTTSCANTDVTLISDKTSIDTDVHVLESDLVSTGNVLSTDNTENDAVLPSDDAVVSATTRCRHATADSSSSVRDYTATGCDVVFSGGIEYRPYGCERHLYDIMELVSRDLSEPYSIYTYRYFIYNWPSLCFRVSIT